MNIKKFFILLVLPLYITHTTASSQTAIDIIFPADMPTKSIYEEDINLIYGAQGLNFSVKEIDYIKKTYCYLEFLTKLDVVTNKQGYQNYKTDFNNFSKPRDSKNVLLPSEELVNSDAWQSITITMQDLVTSNAWQTCLKGFICNSLETDNQFLIDSTQTNNQLFISLPNIEAAYMTTDFTQLRLYQELMQIQATIRNKQRIHYLQQCLDWQKDSIKSLFTHLTLFSKTDFYIYTHQQASINNPPALAYPTREYIILYSMFLQLTTIIENKLNEKNLKNFLKQINSKNILPRFFNYDLEDVVSLSDFISVKNLFENAKQDTKKTIISMKATPSSNQQVTNTQSIQKESNSYVNIDPEKQAIITVFGQIPSISSLNPIIDSIYGSSGLNIPAELLTRIKKSYCYLEFLIKLEKVNNQKEFNQYLKTDFKNFITKNSTGSAFIPDDQLINSSAWKAIPVTQKDLQESDAWQNLVKAMICDIYDIQKNFITDNFQVNNQISSYLANIETAYASQDFTQMRLYNESLQTYAMLQFNQIKIYQAQCLDWKNLNEAKLEQAINQFKKTDFYDLTHNPPTEIPKINGKNKYTATKSPTKEYVACYYLITTIQKDVYALLTPENVINFISQANSKNVTPNFFNYQKTDSINLYDYLVLTELFNASKKNSDTNPDDDDDDDNQDNQIINHQNDNNQNVVIQRTALQRSNDRAKKAFKKMGKDMNKGFKEMSKGMAIATTKIGEGVVEMAAGISYVGLKFGELFDSKINAEAEYKAIRKKMMKHANIIGAVIFTVVLIVIVAALIFFSMGTATPAAAGLMTANTGAIGASTAAGAAGAAGAGTAGAAAGAAGAATQAAIAASAGQLLAATGTAVASAVLPTATVGGAIYATSAIGAAAIGIAAATDPQFKKELTTQVFIPMMKGMAVMTQGLTDRFIEFSTGITWFGCQIGVALGYPVNPEREVAIVRKEMLEHQATINVCMSVFASFIITLAVMAVTAGAGAAWTAYLNSSAAISISASATPVSFALNTVDDVIYNPLVAQSLLQTTVTTTGSTAAIGSGASIGTVGGSVSTTTMVANFADDATVNALGNTGIKEGGKTGIKQGVQQGAKQSVTKSAKSKLLNLKNASKQATNELDDAQRSLELAKANLAKDQSNVFAQTTVKEAEKQVAVKQSLAKNTTDSLTAQQKEIARLASRSSYQIGREEGIRGIGTALKDGFFSYSFLFGQAANAGFNVFSAIGAYNQDEIAIDKVNEERKSIQSLWKFIEDNKVASAQSQASFLSELNKKNGCATVNQTLSLQYYKNFLNSSINNTKNQIAQALAQQQIALLTPDENGQIAADIGSSWGLKTQFVYLYPSQGFITTTLGRPDFPYAQEVAQAPLTDKSLQKPQSNNITLLKNDTIDKMWFNQRAVVSLQKDINTPLSVEIKFRVLYNLTTSYHVGLYLGGKYNNYTSPEYLEKITGEQKVDLNESYLAKMFVLTRDDEKSSPQIGLYEHKGKGWIVKEEIDKKMLNSDTIYHMKANLDNNQLAISFWTENDSKNIWTKNVTVLKCDQSTFGIIFSGIAIEWNVVDPKLSITENQKMRSSDQDQTNNISQSSNSKTDKNLSSLNSLPDQENSKTKDSFSQLQTSAAGSATIELNNISINSDSAGLSIAGSSGFAF